MTRGRFSCHNAGMMIIRYFLKTLFIKKKEKVFLIFAYCLMNNHIHLVIQESEEGLATTIKRLKASYAFYLKSIYQSEKLLTYQESRGAASSIGNKTHINYDKRTVRDC